MRLNFIKASFDRARLLLHTHSVAKSTQTSENAKKMWRAAASLVKPDSPKKEPGLINIVSKASTKKWLQDVLSNRPSKAPTTEASLLSFIQKVLHK